METTPVREQLLQHARRLLMVKGYNGFSYRDLSGLVGVKTSSIHYHFPTKEDLVLEAVREYSAEVLSRVHALDASLSAEERLDRYTEEFGTLLGEGEQICLCCMLASDIESLPDSVREAVQTFFAANEAWLTQVLAQGKQSGTLRIGTDVGAAARALYAAFQGSLLASRLFQSKARLSDVAASIKVH